MDLSLKIDFVNYQEITTEEFREKYFLTNTPVVIKNAFNHLPCKNKWSLDWFANKYKDLKVPVFDNRNPQHKKLAVKEPDLQMNFSDFIKHIETEDKSYYRMFLFNLFNEDPYLRRDFPCPEIAKGILGRIGFSFFGGRNTEVKLHYDVDESAVFLTQFQGKKRIVLFGPENTDFLYRLPFNLHTNVDVDNPDYDKFPALQFVKGYDFIVEDGDMLFMPPKFWHYNTYLTPGFSIAYRKLSPSIYNWVSGFKNIMIMGPLDKLLLKTFGDTWYNFKLDLAEKRANLAMNKELNQGIEIIE